MTLEELTQKLKLPPISAEVVFSGLAVDSRQVQPGFLFIAVPGTATHGEAYLEQALKQGAVAILAEPAVCLRAKQRYPDLLCLETPQVRLKLAQAAALFYPEAPAFRAAVTGTNGKSSVVGFARQLWTFLGEKAASIGTLGLETSFGGEDGFTPLPPLTTPDAISLHRCFQELKIQGSVDHIALEAASHGLDQYRCHGTSFQAGVFTSFSRDHLDYHPDETAYFQAKCRLFLDLMEPGAKALLWGDMKETAVLEPLAQNAGLEVWTYGKKATTLRILSWEATLKGQRARLSCWGKERDVTLPLIGWVQLQNVLAAFGIVVASGKKCEDVAPFLEKLVSIPGRLEWVGQAPQGGDVYVDYAHTPDALFLALQTLRPHTTGKLGVVFGCGGNRDGGKRLEMGKIAGKGADWAIVTDDNPRNEDPALIRRRILQGCPSAQEIAGRGQAIFEALKKLGAGDICVIAGKGHETGQIVRDTVLPFRDREVVAQFLKKGLA